MTFSKNFNDQYYLMMPNFFQYHNHRLPIDDYYKTIQFNMPIGATPIPMQKAPPDEQQEIKNLEKEREQILGKLLKKKKH